MRNNQSEQKIKLLQYPQKTYLEHITYKGRNYDVAIISRSDKKGLIFCYVVRSKNALLSSRITVQDMLGALWLENGAVAFISNESGKILYTNNAEKLGSSLNLGVD